MENFKNNNFKNKFENNQNKQTSKDNLSNKTRGKEEEKNKKEYLDTLKEWMALSAKLSRLFKRKKFLTIAEDLRIYKIADERLIEKANKINGPLPERL